MGMGEACIGDFESGGPIGYPGIRLVGGLPGPESIPKTSGSGLYSIGMALLKQDVSHARKIREHEAREAKLAGLLRLAGNVLVDGDQPEREQVAGQIECVLAEEN